MLKDECSSEQQNSVYQENDVNYDTRPKYPNRDELLSSPLSSWVLDTLGLLKGHPRWGAL